MNRTPRSVAAAIRRGKVKPQDAPALVDWLREDGWVLEGALGYAWNWADCIDRREIADGRSGLLMVLAEAHRVTPGTRRVWNGQRYEEVAE